APPRAAGDDAGGAVPTPADAAIASVTPDAVQVAVIPDAAVAPTDVAPRDRARADRAAGLNSPEAGKLPQESARSQAAIAAKLNEDAKNAIYAGDYESAIRKLQEAIARVPEAKYFVNLCMALLQAGRLEDALTACMAVELNNPTDDQRRKATELITRIRAEAKKRGIELR